MLRTSLEGTLKHIAIKIAGNQESIPANNPAYGVTPADVRRYLQQQGFFEQDEIRYIKEFYGYASTDGSHPGISNESESCQVSGVNVPPLFGNDVLPVFGNDVPPLFSQMYPLPGLVELPEKIAVDTSSLT
jgi:hypothetical protein